MFFLRVYVAPLTCLLNIFVNSFCNYPQKLFRPLDNYLFTLRCVSVATLSSPLNLSTFTLLRISKVKCLTNVPQMTVCLFYFICMHLSNCALPLVSIFQSNLIHTLNNSLFTLLFVTIQPRQLAPLTAVRSFHFIELR